MKTDFEVHIFIVKINTGSQPIYAFMLQINTTIQLLALFKLILYSNLLNIINVTLYFTFENIMFLKK